MCCVESTHRSGLAGVEDDLSDLAYSSPAVHRAAGETLWGAHRCEARVCPPMDQSGEDTSEAVMWRLTGWISGDSSCQRRFQAETGSAGGKDMK